MGRIQRHRLGHGVYHVYEQNPLRPHGSEIDRPWDYRWSSARCYTLLDEAPLVERSAHPFWNAMGDCDRTRAGSYRQFAEAWSDSEGETALFRSNATVIGDDSFRADARQSAGRPHARGRGRRLPGPATKD
jgi:hypothetical protein